MPHTTDCHPMAAIRLGPGKPGLTPAERKLRARIGGLALAAQRDPKEYTAEARRRFLAKFLHEVDPDRQLPEPERNRRADAARRLYFAKLAYKSANARAQKRGKKFNGRSGKDE